MPLTRRAFAGLAAGALVLPLPAGAASPELRLERFFLGRTTGRGRFVSDLAGVDRGFDVVAHGRMDGADLILVEEITYDDGVRDIAAWRFAPSGSGYTGRRTGVETLVPVRVEDGVVRMSYVAEVPGADGAPVRLRFDDVLVQTDASTVVNTADVSLAGVRVGTVEVTFRR